MLNGFDGLSESTILQSFQALDSNEGYKHIGEHQNRQSESEFTTAFHPDFPNRIFRFSLSWFPQQKAVVTLLPNSREHQGSYVKESPSDGSSEKPRRRKKPDGPIPPKRSYSMVNRHRAAKLKRAKKFKREWSRSDVMAAGSFLSSSLSQDDNGACAGKLGNRRTTDRQSTFDIDNIVVDPKVAAVTRVEKLQYKEIQTPK